VLHRNRLALGLAAATLLTWALVGLPIHHQLAEHRDEKVLWKPRALKLKSATAPKPSKPSHHHGAPGHEHAGQSIEHGKALLHAAAPAPALKPVLAELVLPESIEPEAPYRLAWHRTEQPQGP